MVSWTQFLIYSYLSCVTVRLNIIKNSLDHITSLFKLQCKQINLCCRCWVAQSCLTPCDPVKIWCYQSFLFVSFWCHEVESDCGLNLFSSDEQWSWTSFINGHLHTFAAFRIFPHEIFTFFLLVCWNSLHILRLSPLVKYMNCKYFLLLCGWLSTLKEVNFFFCLFDVLVQGPYHSGNISEFGRLYLESQLLLSASWVTRWERCVRLHSTWQPSQNYLPSMPFGK